MRIKRLDIGLIMKTILEWTTEFYLAMESH